MTIFIGDSESLRMQHRDQSRLRGLISIALNLNGAALGGRFERAVRDSQCSNPIPWRRRHGRIGF